MNTFKICLSVLCFVFIAPFAYAQNGYYVDKDYRIKRYQVEMIDFLLKHKQFTDNNLRIKDYSERMFVYKTIELFPWSAKPKRNSILLVKFGSTGDHADHYWGLLEQNSKLFFTNTPPFSEELLQYIKTYDKETQDIIFYTLKLYKPYD